MHKLIRFVTIALASDGYLDFMGNEFGHPEWIDFPREGNNWSYHYARRQWSLVRNQDLKFGWLADFDRDMIQLVNKHKVLSGTKPEVIWLDQHKNLMIFRRNDLIYIFNLHPTWSQQDVFVNCDLTGGGNYRVIFSSDDSIYGGQERISKEHVYCAHHEEYGFGFRLYMPCRTAAVVKKCKNAHMVKCNGSVL